jgi:DNA-binding MarR family transcriptional regulator
MGKKGRDKGGKKERRRAAALADVGTAAGLVPGAASPVPVSPGTTPHQAVDPTELAARLAGLSTVLQRHLARADAGDGLTRARLSALALLVLGGAKTLGELAAAERVRPPTMTRLVHALEADGLVVRERNPADGRSIIIRATPNGEAQLDRGRSRQIAPLAEAIAQLGSPERLQIEDAADLLGRVLREASWEPADPIEPADRRSPQRRR